MNVLWVDHLDGIVCPGLAWTNLWWSSELTINSINRFIFLIPNPKFFQFVNRWCIYVKHFFCPWSFSVASIPMFSKWSLFETTCILCIYVGLSEPLLWGKCGFRRWAIFSGPGNSRDIKFPDYPKKAGLAPTTETWGDFSESSWYNGEKREGREK